MADALAEAFNVGFSVSSEKNDPNAQHPRFADFKIKPKNTPDQNRRRKQHLERQKKGRFDAANYARKLVDGDLEEDEYEEALMEMGEEEGERSYKKRFNPYKEQLMLSEWLVEVPDDMESSWLMVVCPVGKRCLVVANKGYTCAYSKGGYCLNQFPSLLPGGSFKTSKGVNSSKYTLLDCIYDETNRTFWVLDLMCLSGHPVYDTETEFRFFWMQTKLKEEVSGIDQISKVNPFKFIPCTHSQCSPQEIATAVTAAYPYQVDGVLFYHRRAQYHPGRTPLVAWLKPFMIPEILGIPIHVDNSEHTQFNKAILLEANKELQGTISDKSFNSPPKKEGGEDEKPRNPFHTKRPERMDINGAEESASSDIIDMCTTIDSANPPSDFNTDVGR